MQALPDPSQQRGFVPGPHAGKEAPEQLGQARCQGGQRIADSAGAGEGPSRRQEVRQDRSSWLPSDEAARSRVRATVASLRDRLPGNRGRGHPEAPVHVRLRAEN